MAVEYGQQGARVNAEFSSEILHVDGCRPPQDRSRPPPFPRSQPAAAARPLGTDAQAQVVLSGRQRREALTSARAGRRV